MIFSITTTGLSTPVIFNDLGARTFNHPTVSFNLTNEFTIEEIKNSVDIFNAIDLGYITATLDGVNITADGLDSLLVTTVDPRLTVENVINVKKNPGIGEFSSIKNAIDSISGNSITNRYLISVGPGEYTEPELDLSSKPYVSIIGSGIQTTIIKPSLNNHHIFKLGLYNELSFMWLEGSGSGFAAIACIDSGDYSQAHKITFNDCDINVLVTSETQDTFFYGEYLDFNGTYTFGVKVIATNGFKAYANLENYYNFPTSSATGTYVSGVGSSASIITSGNKGNDLGTGMLLEDGAQVDIQAAYIEHWENGIVISNTGAFSILDAQSLDISDCATYHLNIDHASSEGGFIGSLNTNLVVNQSSSFVISATDHENKNILLGGIVKQINSDGSTVDISTLIGEGSTMGVMEGGKLSVSGVLEVGISAGFGYLEIEPQSYKRYDWSTTTLTVPVSSVLYIYIDSTDTLQSSLSSPDTRYNILLGRVVTDATDILFVENTGQLAEHATNLIEDFNRKALGAVYHTGSTVTENNIDPFHLDVSSGQYYLSANKILLSGGTDINFISYYRDGSGDWILNTTNTVNNSQYDDNSGALQSITAGYYVKHSLYAVGSGPYEKYMLVYAQTEWSTLLLAQQSELPLPPTYFNESIVPIAAIIVQEGAVSITQIRDIRPTIAFRSEGINAASEHGSLLGLADDDHTQYLLTNGGRTLTGNLNLGNNSITNINSLTVTSFTPGQVVFPSTGGLLSGSSNLFWDVATNRLGIGNSSPTVTLDVTGSIKLSGTLTIDGLSGILKTTAGAVTGSASTSDLPEGTNLYYNDTRVHNAITGTLNRITSLLGVIDIASTYVGQTSITTLGTIGTGTWNGSIISPTYGGTGINNASRTLTINTNSGTLDFTSSSTTLTVANNATVSGTNTGDQTLNSLLPSQTGNSGKVLQTDGSNPSWSDNYGTFGITIDGAGNVITTGFKQYLIVPYNCVVIGWYIIANAVGSCVIDVWKDVTIPTSGDSITGTEKPTLTGQQTNSDSSLSTWTTTVNANDIIGFNVDSISGLSKITLVIKVRKI